MQVRSQSWVVLGTVISLLLALGGLFVRSVTPAAGEEPRRQADKINLALRRTAHHLLRASGDSTSRIPAVQQLNANTYRLQLNHAFNYDTLPALLQQSLQQHHIATPYDVAVLDCGTQQLQLGYSVSDLIDSNTVACSGRSMAAGCYVLQLTFAAPITSQVSYWPVLAVISLLAGLMVVTWRRPAATLVAAPAEAETATPKLHFGRSVLDINGQTLLAGETTHTLTYRETKLLRLLASHPNQVLERNQILKLVWEDEGIIVGRSVDVFISRLRKLLSTDATLRIGTIHGVGYRLEVLQS
ncbi:Transcriptional regulatory protein rprY [Fibrella aestuarina BUZ 2]|uniref:Transcriptional regulatory protein rprY n=1 Tax=Fibrella aestuarina BUZ 2 TaxID=1166018 RepID=I0K1W0_9BACT|nr:winged helix-turn-helix domain-containing protein [Fibrella aestuarina]CCG98113.1 Transcriptional regulatory protein rprY [Fibrella aestuarina BUZ 2]